MRSLALLRIIKSARRMKTLEGASCLLLPKLRFCYHTDAQPNQLFVMQCCGCAEFHLSHCNPTSSNNTVWASSTAFTGLPRLPSDSTGIWAPEWFVLSGLPRQPLKARIL